jgi:hypothetical protein
VIRHKTPSNEQLLSNQMQCEVRWVSFIFPFNHRDLLAEHPNSLCIADDSEAAGVIASLREKIAAQTTQIDVLRQKLATQAKEHEVDVCLCGAVLAAERQN